jgi:hypothetical protein
VWDGQSYTRTKLPAAAAVVGNTCSILDSPRVNARSMSSM